MKKIAGMLVLVSVLASPVRGQERIQTIYPLSPLSPTVSDTTSWHSVTFFVLPPSFGLASRYQPDFFDRIPVGQRLFIGLPITNKLDIGASWKQQLEWQKKYQTWYIILGSLSAAGAGYVAYQHIKKYGLFP